MMFYFGKYKELRAKLWMHTYTLKRIVYYIIILYFSATIPLQEKTNKKQAKKRKAKTK